MLRGRRFETPNMTRTDKVGSQLWTAVSSFLHVFKETKCHETAVSFRDTLSPYAEEVNSKYGT